MHARQARQRGKVIWLSLFLLSGCASEPKHEYALSEILASPFRIRRPLGHPADPQAGPGGSDYQSDPLPDAQYDCQKPDFLLKDIPTKSLLKCLQSITQELTVQYRLKRDVQPELTLDVSEEDLKNPEFIFPRCLVQTLPRLPVPREILVMGRGWNQYEETRQEQQQEEYEEQEGEQLYGRDAHDLHDSDKKAPPECFSARLNIEANQVLGIRLPKGKQAVKVDFPLENAPKTLEELKRTLLAWILTPLFLDQDPSLAQLKSKYVPQAICERCFGEKPILKPSEPLSPSWP